jgi:hypothetical protein
VSPDGIQVKALLNGDELPAPENSPLTDEAAMKQILSLSFAILAIAATLSATPASAQPRSEFALVLMLGVGY